ncbi:MAG TPA: metallophosphoesterase [Kofleriaceae bacterium]|nr:metallophosphoesterase [Kofleriaceae bacterium]
MRRLVLVLAAAAACDPHSAGAPQDAYVVLDAPAHAGAGRGGGLLDELRFAVVGDTRPTNLDDTAHYPTDIVLRIWNDVLLETPTPQFAVTTGDYMFASSKTGSEVDPQLDLYLGARLAFPGWIYPAMGNHECTGDTDSNCGPGNIDGETPNYIEFMRRMLEPIGVTSPYYVERFAAKDGSWSAKFVFMAANAWNNAQAAWFDRALGDPTTYTFVVRHEPHDAESAPGVDPSQAIMARHPLTMLLVGHTHTYEHVPAYRELIVGNGGAPLTSAFNFGYVIIARQDGGTLQVTSYDFASHAIVDQFQVNPDGTLVQ